mmetsp:Transcript_13771/g.41918  ORF Transcript_13771/g.41918 Transcript_13771/m.41918 type:complete len:201 (+) Transcript_13771:361-963(+)|eukprot:scaffold263053_cov32-Tisochrysis_lutea.AAC.2
MHEEKRQESSRNRPPHVMDSRGSSSVVGGQTSRYVKGIQVGLSIATVKSQVWRARLKPGRIDVSRRRGSQRLIWSGKIWLATTVLSSPSGSARRPSSMERRDVNHEGFRLSRLETQGRDEFAFHPDFPHFGDGVEALLVKPRGGEIKGTRQVATGEEDFQAFNPTLTERGICFILGSSRRLGYSASSTQTRERGYRRCLP